jgi:antitoxin CptB
MDDTSVRRKRVLYRSRYRGFLESDLLLERFVRANLVSLSASRLDELEALLDEDDEEIWAWVTGQAPIPARHDNEIMTLLRGAVRDA